MRQPWRSEVLLAGVALVLFAWHGPAALSSQVPPSPAYGVCPPSPDGIGKSFHGREISQVMGHPGIGWLERSTREREEAPTKAIALLGLAPDAVIADVGAGSGYYAFRLAPLLPKGEVVAIDIQPEMLEFLTRESVRRGVRNVRPHLGSVTDLRLPAGCLDAALMVDAYHEFDHPAEMLSSLRQALKPTGRVYLIEFRAEDAAVPIKPHHKMTEAQARKEFESAGYRFLENKPGLPWQHLMVFERR